MDGAYRVTRLFPGTGRSYLINQASLLSNESVGTIVRDLYSADKIGASCSKLRLSCGPTLIHVVCVFQAMYQVDRVLFVDELASTLKAYGPSVLYLNYGLNTDSNNYSNPDYHSANRLSTCYSPFPGGGGHLRPGSPLPGVGLQASGACDQKQRPERIGLEYPHGGRYGTYSIGDAYPWGGISGPGRKLD